MDADRIGRSIARIAHEIVERNKGVDDLALVGVRTRGVPIARRLARALREITGPSGGYTEVVRSSEDLGPATQRIAEELNSQYTLGFATTRPQDGSWRTIRVRVKNRDYIARARRGYFATPPRD